MDGVYCRPHSEARQSGRMRYNYQIYVHEDRVPIAYVEEARNSALTKSIVKTKYIKFLPWVICAWIQYL